MSKMQKVVSTEIVKLDRDSQEYKGVMSEYLRIGTRENGEEKANEDFENVNEEFSDGTKKTHIFDDGTVRVLIQLNFLSPTLTKDTNEYSNHIQSWCILAGEEEEKIFLIQEIELNIFCMHEGGH
jgi:hypothetical protein